MGLRTFVIALVLVATFMVLLRDPHSVTFGSHTFRAEIVDDAPGQARGLSGRDALADDAAMLFVFETPEVRAFWMKDMRFAIDIIWIRGSTVVGIAKYVQPEPGIPDADLTRYRSPDPVDRVVEVVAGTADRIDIHEGDVLKIER